MLEVQYHPADVSSPPRYFFFSGWRLRALTAGMVVGLALVLAGVPLIPQAVSGLWVVVKVKEEQRTMRYLRAERQILAAKEREAAARVNEGFSTLRRMALVLGQKPPELAGDTLVAHANSLVNEVEGLSQWARAHRELLALVPALSPLPAGSYEVSSFFGSRVSPFTGTYEWHKGMDFAAEEGVQVRATGGGVVVFAGRAGMDNPSWARLGNVVVVSHGGLYLSVYAHLRRVLVREGEKVQRGQVVGEVGSTGWSTAPHLHYEVRKVVSAEVATPVDPRFFMLDYPWQEDRRAVGGGTEGLDLLPEEKEILPWLKTNRFPR
ncbi:MAG: M23 family metallopeptidase [Thermoanaerobaculum sp.]